VPDYVVGPDGGHYAGRIDLGHDEMRTHNGGRLPLFDRSHRSVITFVPEIPTRQALDDTGYSLGSTYAVIVPGYPDTNTLQNIDGGPLLSPNNRIFTSSFTTISSSSSQYFLGAESSGTPRLIHSAPFNGDTGVAVTEAIRLRFSQPLDPRTVDSTQFKVELVSVVPNPNYPSIPVSVFLAQQRLGKVEVTLTPINPMPADGTIRVSISGGIEDLVGRAIPTTTISFFTGASIVPPPAPVTFEFDESGGTINLYRDAALTTANWNNEKPYVGGVDGELTAAFAPYAGDGSDGALTLAPGSTQTLDTGTSAQRLYNYTSVTVDIGASLIVTGSYPLVIHCQGDVNISGTVNLVGGAGSDGFTGPDVGTTATGGLGGAGGPGGAAGGAGAFAVLDSGHFDGLNGFGAGGGKGGFTGQNDAFTGTFWPRLRADGVTPQTCDKNTSTQQPFSYTPCRQREGGGGGGYAAAGSDSANHEATQLGSPAPNGGDGGPAWGDAALSTVASNNLSVEVFDPATSGLKPITLTGIPTLGAGSGGSGGGGGGGEDDDRASGTGNFLGVAEGSDDGAGGGGGGGGSFQVCTYGNILVAGSILVTGGNGGSSYTDVSRTTLGEAAGGGGGSGGTIWLQCRGDLTVQAGSIFNVAGGTGGSGHADGTTNVYAAGTGAAGRIRLEDSDGAVANAPAAASLATRAPALEFQSSAVSTWQNTGIFTPDFSQPDVDADAHTEVGAASTLKIYLQGAPEDVSTQPDDPDLANATGWILVWDSTVVGGIVAGNPWDQLDNHKWWRFKVDFDVDPLHTFTDLMPTVRMIRVNVGP
jgi:hypothetical protein